MAVIIEVPADCSWSTIECIGVYLWLKKAAIVNLWSEFSDLRINTQKGVKVSL